MTCIAQWSHWVLYMPAPRIHNKNKSISRYLPYIETKTVHNRRHHPTGSEEMPNTLWHTVFGKHRRLYAATMTEKYICATCCGSIGQLHTGHCATSCASIGQHMSFDCSREVNPSLAAQTTANRLDGFKSGSTSICGASSHSVKKSSRFTGLTSISRRIPLHLSLPYTAELTYLRLKP